MTVVGHVEQMHLSKCYRESKTLTCLTCHSPHNEPKPGQVVDHYKAACLKCHQQAECKVDERRRQLESPVNDCVHCHMPRSPTEIPHLAFTHHRISKYGTKDTVNQPGMNQLRPLLDDSRLSDIDRRRSLGLGLLETANREKDPARAGRFQDQAFETLSRAWHEGLRDPALDTGLARLHFDLGLKDVAPYVESALAHPDLAGQDRCTALFLRADASAAAKQFREAATDLRELVKLRRHPVDWLLLADCESALGNQAAAEDALLSATRINPRLWKVHQDLADLYRRRQNLEKAKWHQDRAVP